MRNLFFIAALLFFSANCFAQYDWEMSKDEIQAQRMKTNVVYKKIKENHLKNAKQYITDKNGKTRLYSVVEYSTEGKQSAYSIYGKKEVLIIRSQSIIDKDGETYIYETYNNGKLREKWETRRNSKEMILVSTGYNKKGNVFSKYEYTYDTSDNNTSMVVTKEKGKPLFKWEYDYYPNGSKKAARWYNGKNKLKDVYSYDCATLPKTAKEMDEDTNRACIKYEYDSKGNKMKMVENHYKRGRIYLTRFTYDKNDNLIKEEVSNSRKPKLYTTYEAEYDAQNKPVSVKYYKPRSSKIYAIYTYAYDLGGVITYISCVEKRNPRTMKYQYEKY
ncbi:MAG: hypothetical protein NTX03_07225 [Bacteroidetes bacterium]|nr:hypothetical protein [Bacteroidota bacterium]